jgi:hypothetical protein
MEVAGNRVLVEHPKGVKGPKFYEIVYNQSDSSKSNTSFHFSLENVLYEILRGHPVTPKV